MDGLDELEEYLRTARIMEVCAFPATTGGAHPKALVILDGGVGLLAKPADANADAPEMVTREAAAWTVARHLGWTDLVSTTVVRTIPSPTSGADVEASVAVAWPSHQPDTDPAGFSDDDIWRAAVFDFLIDQSDRSGHNWLSVPDPALGQPKLKLVDHGYAFWFPGRPLGSTFFAAKQGQDLPDSVLAAVKTMLAAWPIKDLDDLLDAGIVSNIEQRARDLEQNEALIP
jgi:hypothetical protein